MSVMQGGHKAGEKKFPEFSRLSRAIITLFQRLLQEKAYVITVMLKLDFFQNWLPVGRNRVLGPVFPPLIKLILIFD